MRLFEEKATSARCRVHARRRASFVATPRRSSGTGVGPRGVAGSGEALKRLISHVGRAAQLVSEYVQLCLKGSVRFTADMSLVWSRRLTVAERCIIRLPLCSRNETKCFAPSGRTRGLSESQTVSDRSIIAAAAVAGAKPVAVATELNGPAEERSSRMQRKCPRLGTRVTT